MLLKVQNHIQNSCY